MEGRKTQTGSGNFLGKQDFSTLSCALVEEGSVETNELEPTASLPVQG